MIRQLFAGLVLGVLAWGPSDYFNEAAWAKKRDEKIRDFVPVEVRNDGKTPNDVYVRSNSTGELGVVRKYGFTLKQLGTYDAFEIRGVDGSYSVPFSIPADEVVSEIKLKLNYTYSPALISQISHLKVMMNSEVVATIPLPKENAGSPVSREISLNPKYLADYNQLQLQLIGHYTYECEDPLHSSLWLKVSNQSELEFTVTPLSLQNDLALLPLPFFDKRDGRRLELPFLFAAAPSAATLEAAGITASWFGSLASYRGALFPAHLNNLPNQNLVAFATTQEAPAGLNLPAISGPTVAVISHPNDIRYKILLVMGRDGKEIKTAASALAFGKGMMSGTSTVVTQLKEEKARKPYDAPNWLPSDRPVKLGELNDLRSLNVAGLRPDLVRVNTRIPPDLFAWKSEGIPLDLKYRYTPRPQRDKSTLNVNVDRYFVTSIPLMWVEQNSIDDYDRTIARLKKALLPDGTMPVQERVYIPPYMMPARAQLQFHFAFDYLKHGHCKDVLVDNLRAAIDPDSTIDLTAFPHYLAMPNLAAFGNAGFPFTRMADLSETAVIFPDSYSSLDLGAYLTLMGRMGESTGYPTTGVVVGRAADAKNYANKDLLILGSASNQPLFSQWAKYMPFSTNGESRNFEVSDLLFKFNHWLEGLGASERIPRRAEISLSGASNEAALFGFESPLSSGRSVVAVMTSRANNLFDLLGVLMDPELITKVQGALVVVRGKEVESLAVGSTYYVGSLPVWTYIRWFFSNNPLVLALLGLLAAIVVAVLLYRILRVRAEKRLSGKV
ncbi:cellulose biosynthesis cyclic di-GMP-binding regulatory protein BcsB [Parvibium lacunae]|uniref:Cyclic di-GMP-binding protein n=1 Tax=Parvibium lacunae TaxID=1888893 RepID=A0A368L849_9BURK|nr:cellulose biosynthesis cyclic di-GMP-binding regulatory protein BcsB [Parvibium lacunae]RCS59806.1 cellulose biosynthesis cyclic di-GMP-binding regulatory protein BcsB [Parvibium lacunae]